MEPSSCVEQQLVPTVVACGNFGNISRHRVETTKYKVIQRGTGDVHFTSNINFINLKIKFELQATQAYSLLVKVTPEDPLYMRVLYIYMHYYTQQYHTRIS